MTPSRDVNEIARRHARELPRSLRALLRTMGANNAASTLLLSYLLFERGFHPGTDRAGLWGRTCARR